MFPFPSLITLRELGDVTDEEILILEPFAKTHATNPAIAILVVTGLRASLTVEDFMASNVLDIDEEQSTRDKFQNTVLFFNNQQDAQRVQKISWLLSENLTEEQIIHYSAAYLRYGESFIPTLIALNKEPKISTPISFLWLDKFVVFRQELRKEGIVLPLSTTLLLASHWEMEDVLALVEKDSNLDEALKIRNNSEVTVDEAQEYMEHLPAQWLEEFFGDDD